MSLASTSTSSTRLSSASSSSTGNMSGRRKVDRFTRGRRSNAPREPTSSMKEAVPELANLIKSVVTSIDDQAQLKQHHAEKKRKQALAERAASSSSRPITRTSSARQIVSAKKQPLSRRMSEDMLNSSGKSASRSRLSAVKDKDKDSLADRDMEWVPSLSPPRFLQKQDSGETEDPYSFSTVEDRRRVELPHDTLPATPTEEYLPKKTRKLLTTQDLMPPPPKPKPKPVKSQTQIHHIHSSKDSKPTVVSHGQYAPAPCTPPPPPLPPPQHTVSASQYKASQNQKLPSSSQSQSHRPPALGMRRTATSSSSSTSLSSSQTLPSKQRGFKPPFARPQTSVSPTTTTGSSTSKDRHGLAMESTPRTYTRASDPPCASVRTRSPSPVPDALGMDPDSSYGEISFDIDMDVVEETMRQYDEV